MLAASLFLAVQLLWPQQAAALPTDEETAPDDGAVEETDEQPVDEADEMAVEEEASKPPPPPPRKEKRVRKQKAPAKKAEPRAARRTPAGRQLPEMTDEEAIATLRDPSRAPADRQNAVRVLAFGEAAAAEEELSRVVIEDPEVAMRFLAVRALEHRKQGGRALAQVLVNDSDPRARRAAARALGRLGPDGTRQEPALVSALDDPDLKVVAEAAAALRHVGSRASQDMLKTLREAPQRSVRVAAKRAVRAINERTRARDQLKERVLQSRVIRADPRGSTPLMYRFFKYSGTAYAMVSTAALGAAAASVFPVSLSGRNGVYWWPVTAPLGAVAGGALGLGYGLLRRFDFPITDAVMISVHGASGFASGIGFGMWLGKRSPPGSTAALGLLGGSVSLLASAGASPWLKTRPSSVLSAASGGLLGGTATLLAAGAFGYDVFQKPELALGLAFMGQGVGTVMGTVVGALPVTSVDVLLVDFGAVTGGGLATAAAVLALALPRTGLSTTVVNGAVLGGMALGAGAGAVVAALLPATFENRLTMNFLDEIPLQIVPALPSPTIQPETGKVSGAVLPVLHGTFR